jgi:hypothetical protein
MFPIFYFEFLPHQQKIIACSIHKNGFTRKYRRKKAKKFGKIINIWIIFDAPVLFIHWRIANDIEFWSLKLN